jgi:hypothetical protein
MTAFWDPQLSMTLMRGIGPAPRRIGQAVRSGRCSAPPVDLPGRARQPQWRAEGQKADGARPRNAITSLLATAGGAHQSTRPLLGARSSSAEFMLVRVRHWSMPRLPMPQQNRRTKGEGTGAVRLSSPVDPSSPAAAETWRQLSSQLMYLPTYVHST